MDRQTSALVIVLLLLLLGLILAFAGRATLRLGWNLATSGIVLATVAAAVVIAVVVYVLPAAREMPPGVSASASAVATATATPVSGAQVHVVARGDTLRALARRYYGNENAWRRIYDANRPLIANPDSLVVGVRLVIPPPP